MGMYLDEAAGDKLIDGTEGCHAVLHHGGSHIEVWCEDYERHYGNVPADFTAREINVAIAFFRAGERKGEEFGKLAKQAEIRRVLGLD
ncbi:MAG: hypothetical protein ACN6OP_28340 [Pseudomonadales bacterium]